MKLLELFFFIVCLYFEKKNLLAMSSICCISNTNAEFGSLVNRSYSEVHEKWSYFESHLQLALS